MLQWIRSKVLHWGAESKRIGRARVMHNRVLLNQCDQKKQWNHGEADDSPHRACQIVQECGRMRTLDCFMRSSVLRFASLCERYQCFCILKCRNTQPKPRSADRYTTPELSPRTHTLAVSIPSRNRLVKSLLTKAQNPSSIDRDDDKKDQRRDAGKQEQANEHARRNLTYRVHAARLVVAALSKEWKMKSKLLLLLRRQSCFFWPNHMGFFNHDSSIIRDFKTCIGGFGFYLNDTILTCFPI